MKSLFTLLFLFILTSICFSQPFARVTLLENIFKNNADGDIAWGDYNGDGFMDFALMGMSSYCDTCDDINVKVYKNINGAFEEIALNTPKVYRGDIDWVDYDNDGDLDLFVTGFNKSGETELALFNNDNDTFTNTYLGIAAFAIGEASWGDYDNDGDLDLLITGRAAGMTNVTSLYENVNGNFIKKNINLPGVYVSTADWGDFDNDGDLDILLTGTKIGSWEDQICKIYRNDNGSFTDIYANLKNLYAGAAKWVDYNDDGWPDITMSGWDDSEQKCKTIIYKNISGNFVNINAAITGVQEGSFDWGDYDNDGDKDLLILGSGDEMAYAKLYRNIGNDKFDEYNYGLQNFYLASCKWVDYDNDGDLDISMCGSCYSDADGWTRHTLLYKNILNNNNHTVTVPAFLGCAADSNNVYLKWDLPEDPGGLSNKLCYNVVLKNKSGKTIITPMSNLQNGKLLLPFDGNAGKEKFYKLSKLEFGDYTFSVQSIDNGYVGSQFSQPLEFSYTSPGCIVYNNTDTLKYLEKSDPVKIVSVMPPLRFIDGDIKKVEVSFDNKFVFGEDSLIYVNLPSVSAVTDTAKRCFYFEGSLSKENVNNLLSSLQYYSPVLTKKNSLIKPVSVIIYDSKNNKMAVQRNLKLSYINDSPVISNFPSLQSYLHENSAGLNLWDYVSDQETVNENMNYKFVISNDSVSASYNNANGKLTFNIQKNFYGSCRLDLTVTDADGGIAKDSMVIRVLNSLPKFSNLPDTLLFVNDSTHLNIWDYVSDFEDKDEELNYKFVVNNNFVTPVFNKSDGKLYFNIEKSFYGIAKMNVTVKDFPGDSASAVVYIKVNNSLPVISGFPDSLSCINDSTYLNLWEYVSDRETNTVDLNYKFTTTSDSVKAVYNKSDGKLRFDVKENFYGKAEIYLIVTDSNGDSANVKLLVEVCNNVTNVGSSLNNIPTTYELNQNYPNPFNPNTKIKYGLPKASFVSLKVYNTLGEEIAALVNEERSAGNYVVEFNGANFPSGVYFYRIQAGNFVQTKKLLLMK